MEKCTLFDMIELLLSCTHMISSCIRHSNILFLEIYHNKGVQVLTLDEKLDLNRFATEVHMVQIYDPRFNLDSHRIYSCCICAQM